MHLGYWPFSREPSLTLPIKVEVRCHTLETEKKESPNSGPPVTGHRCPATPARRPGSTEGRRGPSRQLCCRTRRHGTVTVRVPTGIPIRPRPSIQGSLPPVVPTVPHLLLWGHPWCDPLSRHPVSHEGPKTRLCRKRKVWKKVVLPKHKA